MPTSAFRYMFRELINQEIVVVAPVVLRNARYLLSPQLFLSGLHAESAQAFCCPLVIHAAHARSIISDS